jgi:hypothetical protein
MSDANGGLGDDPTFDADEERVAALDADGDVRGTADGGEPEIEGPSTE